MPRRATLGLVLALALAGIVAVAAQLPSLGPLDPRSTEQWSPAVPVVQPQPYRPSPPPAGAIVLLGSTGLGEWQAANGGPAAWAVDGEIVTVNKAAGSIRTRRRFMDYRLHLEWRTPLGITGRGQARGNSGLFLGATGSGDDGYELQILDSYRNETYVNGQAGAIYKQYAPLANPMRPPGEWNTYDVAWTAPRFGTDGALRSPARVTASMNGVLIQNNVPLKGETHFIGAPSYRAHGALPILLQAHGDPSPPISFRNVWLVEGR